MDLWNSRHLMPSLPGKISHHRVGALVDLHCNNLDCLLSSHLSLMIPSSSLPSTPSSPAVLLLRKGPWHHLWMESICSVQPCHQYQRWVAFSVHKDRLPGDFSHAPARGRYHRRAGSLPIESNSWLLATGNLLIHGNVVVKGRDSNSRCLSYYPKSSCVILLSSKPVRLKMRKDSEAARGLVLAVHSHRGDHCQGKGGSGVAQLGSDRCWSWKMTI